MPTASLLSLLATADPDLCYHLGICGVTPAAGPAPNLLFLATAMVLGGVLLHRSARKR
ncbi:MAG: hypothetical protein AB7I33_11575 [Gemmatimonadales bacterium]